MSSEPFLLAFKRGTRSPNVELGVKDLHQGEGYHLDR
jgi:hypothetical protein